MARTRNIITNEGAQQTVIWFDDREVQEFFEKLKTVPDKIKRSELNKILKRQFAPVLAAVKSGTPVRKRLGSGKYGQQPGNLLESMVIQTSRAPRIGVWIGPKVNKFRGKDRKASNLRRRDGYYGFWLEYGFHPGRGSKFVRGTNFIEQSAAQVIPLVEREITKGVKEYIVKNMEKILKK